MPTNRPSLSFANDISPSLAAELLDQIQPEISGEAKARLAAPLSEQLRAVEQNRRPDEATGRALASELSAWQIASVYLNFALRFIGQDDAERAAKIARDAAAATMAAAEQAAAAPGGRAFAKIATDLAADAAHIEDDSGTASASASAVVMNVRMVSGMMGEIRRATNTINARAEDARKHAADALTESECAGARVVELADTVARIETTAESIRRIARQTNLLALNATIEAARAGDAGKGFAVVATEVKSLARDVATATESINLQLGAIRQAAGEVTRSMDVVRESFDAVRRLMDGVVSGLQEHDQSATQVASCAEEAADSVETIASTLDRIAAVATEVGQKMSAMQGRLAAGT